MLLTFNLYKFDALSRGFAGKTPDVNNVWPKTPSRPPGGGGGIRYILEWGGADRPLKP